MVSFKGSRSQFDAGTVLNFYLMGLGCPLLLGLSDRRLRRCAATVAAQLFRTTDFKISTLLSCIHFLSRTAAQKKRKLAPQTIF